MKKIHLLLFLPLLFLVGCSFDDDAGDTLPAPKEEVPPSPGDGNGDGNGTGKPDIEAPSIPENLLVFNLSFESLSLSWSPSSDNVKVEGYELFLNGISHRNLSGTSIELPDLDPGTAYSFSVLAIDSSGNASQRCDELEATTLLDSEPPSVPEGLHGSSVSKTSLTLNWEPSTDNAGVQDYDIFLNEVFHATSPTTELYVENLEPGTLYYFNILARDIYGNVSEHSSPLEITTENEPATPAASSLFFSEYLEGSSFNKALEIVNLSGSEIDLSIYSLKKITNENENWSDERRLEGVLSQRAVFVMAHSGANEAILAVADAVLGGGIMSFNGNDVIGLFQNGELVDVIGQPGGENFAKDVTLRRKETVTASNSIYDPSEWEILDLDNTSGLGSY